MKLCADITHLHRKITVIKLTIAVHKFEFRYKKQGACQMHCYVTRHLYAQYLFCMPVCILIKNVTSCINMLFDVLLQKESGKRKLLHQSRKFLNKGPCDSTIYLDNTGGSMI